MKRIFHAISGFFHNLAYAIHLVYLSSRLYFYTAILFSALSGLSGVIEAVFLREIINRLQLGSNYYALAICAVIIVFGLLLNKLVSRLLFGLNRIVTDKLAFLLELRILRVMDHADTAQMDDPGFLNQLEQVTNLVKSQPTSLFMCLFGSITELVGLIGYIVILVGFHPLAPVVLLSAAALLCVVNNRYEENVMSFLFRMSPQRRKMAYYAGLITSRDSFEEVRTYQSAPYFRSLYEQSMQVQLHEAWAIFRKNGIQYILSAIASYGGCAAVLLWILAQARNGFIDLGSVTMLISACIGIQAVCVELADGCMALPPMLEMLRRYEQFTNSIAGQADTNVYTGAEPDLQAEYAIRFDHVSFRYPGGEKDVLSDTSFSIRPGTTVALVGVNGAGKSTIAKLILGLYDAYTGTIFLGGVDARALSPQARSKFLCALFQSYLKPDLSLRDAVTLGARVPDSAVLDALRRSGTLETPLDTPLGKLFSPDGWIPSVGQWQKIALARLLCRNPACMILDEPSASLDPQAELEMFRMVEGYHREKTVLFITHRLASIVDADEVLFLTPGGNIRQAVHAELLKTCAEYSELYHAQADRYAC